MLFKVDALQKLTVFSAERFEQFVATHTDDWHVTQQRDQQPGYSKRDAVYMRNINVHVGWLLAV